MTSGCTRRSSGSSRLRGGAPPRRLGPAKNRPARRTARGASDICSEFPSVGLPARLRLGAGLFEVDVLVDVSDPRKRNEVMLAAGIRVVLRQLDLIAAFQMVHGANVHAV